MKVLSIVGARPQFIKAAAVSRALRKDHVEVLVHTGQHYDYQMSEVFFAELGIPAPDINLGVGSGTHGEQTGEMLAPLERLMCEQKPDWVLVYGDTNTTLAGALAASKLCIPVAHVEAGLRSFDRSMPEEINRVVTDHIASLLLCPTPAAVVNLKAEGITSGVELVGDVMLDTALYHSDTWAAETVLREFDVEAGGFYLATVHRAANTDSAERLSAIVDALTALHLPVVWPIHPRTQKMLATFGLESHVLARGDVRAVTPLSYRETVALLRNAAGLLTDSGGMQKEAYFFSVPCVTLREETEWVETVDAGWNTLVGADTEAIAAAALAAARPAAHPDLYGDGHAAEKIVAALERHVLGKGSGAPTAQ
jgi:UDP-GlcNAc3NAcA epimerase